MTPSNKIHWKIWAIAILIIVFSLTMRLDITTSHPKGVDTYNLYTLSEGIQEEKYIVWNTDILTVLGITSFSYPPGGILFLAETSLITGISLENTIFIWNICLVLISAILVFLISKEVFKENIVSLLIVLIYLNTRFFIAYSTFFTSRNLLHIFFLSILLLLLKKESIKNSILIIGILCVSLITHRATLLIGIFIVAFIISKMTFRIYNNKRVYNIALVVLGLAIFLASTYIFGHTNIGSETTKIPFKIGINYLDSILSILFSLSMNFGILIILLPIGYFLLITKKEKTEQDFFILITLTLSAAFVVETIYFFYLFLPIMMILLGYFLEWVFSNIQINAESTFKKRKIINTKIKAIIAATIIILLIVPIYITIRESKSDILTIRDQTSSLANFLYAEKMSTVGICNNHDVYCAHISALNNEVKTLTHTSNLLMADQIKVTRNKIDFERVKANIVVTENILETALFSDTYTSAIINWNNDEPTLKKLLDFTNVGYIIDSTNQDSINNRPKIEKKFEYTNTIYDNGLQQVKVIQ